MALMLFHHWNQLSSASVGWCQSQNMEEEALRAESRVPSHLDERHEQRVVLVYTLAVGLKTKPTSPEPCSGLALAQYLNAQHLNSIFSPSLLKYT